MNKSLLTASLCACFFGLKAQNTFPTTGNVGIGTTSPGEKLEVNGAIKLTGVGNIYHGSDSRLNLYNNTNAGNSRTWIEMWGNDPGSRSGELTLAATYINLRYGSNETGSIGSVGMTLSSQGNVGIGISNPNEKLEVFGNAIIHGDISTNGGITRVKIGSAYGPDMDWGAAYVGFNMVRDAQTGTWSMATDGASNGGAVMYSTVGGDLIFSCVEKSSPSNVTQSKTDLQVSASKVMKISSQGKVVIGSMRPVGSYENYKLGVDGSIVAKELIVQDTEWADYVFNKGYDLKSLEEIEAYIEENGHLPGIPSAQKIKEDAGVNVGEMQKLQMEKIEEITLYLIQLKKENQLLKEEINSLKK